jgi:hypothetical protein
VLEKNIFFLAFRFRTIEMPGKLRFGIVSDKSRKDGHGRCWCKGVNGFKSKVKGKGRSKQNANDIRSLIVQDSDSEDSFKHGFKHGF